jgi:hypothetical protein
MGSFLKTTSAVVEDVKAAIRDAHAVEFEDAEVLEVLEANGVDREDVAEAVRALLKKKQDADLRFESVEWDEYLESIVRAAELYI